MKFQIGAIAGSLVVALVMLASVAYSQTSGNSQENDRSQRRAMQRAMMEACANQSAGTSCSFSREGRTVSGVCQATPRGKLICRGGRGERGRGMRDSNGEGMSEDYRPEQ